MSATSCVVETGLCRPFRTLVMMGRGLSQGSRPGLRPIALSGLRATKERQVTGRGFGVPKGRQMPAQGVSPGVTPSQQGLEP
jgi:hypothetical protein